MMEPEKEHQRFQTLLSSSRRLIEFVLIQVGIELLQCWMSTYCITQWNN